MKTLETIKAEATTKATAAAKEALEIWATKEIVNAVENCAPFTVLHPYREGLTLSKLEMQCLNDLLNDVSYRTSTDGSVIVVAITDDYDPEDYLFF